MESNTNPSPASGSALEVGSKVIIYTLIMRGNAQTSYVGAVTAITQYGVEIDGASGKTFFPWTAIERITF
ncbi:MAG: hypothetical protein OHK0029_42050 [Armatimonadaceae bacterium]